MSSLSRYAGIALVCFALGVLLGWKGCTRKGGSAAPATRDTVVVRDTVLHPWRDTVRLSVPTLVRETRVDSFVQYEPMGSPADKDYYTLREYRDAARFGDSTVGGRIEVKAMVAQNRLAYHQVVVDSLYYPQTTVTITRELPPPPPRNSVWAGWTAGYDPGARALYTGPTLTFQHKRGWAVEAGPMLSTYGTVGGMVSLKKKISFRKP